MIVVEKYSVQCYSLQFSNGQLMCTFIWNNWNPFNSWSFVYHFVMRWHEQEKKWVGCETNKFYEYNELLWVCSLDKLAIVCYLYYWYM